MAFKRKRMAGDNAPDGLDALIASVREEGKQDRYEDLLENARQYTEQQAARPEVDIEGLIENRSQTAEQIVANDLLYKGVMPEVFPANLYEAGDLTDKSRLGIAGPFQSDSYIKQSTVGRLNDEDDLEVTSKPIFTEYLSDPTEEKLFKAWQDLNPKERGRRDKFNEAVSEYYGQQALKAIGNTPVIDENRSTIVQKGQRNDYSQREPQYGLRLNPKDSTVGTDRFIENSVGILNPEIDRSGDYRYVDENNYLTVGDYQMGDAVGTGKNMDDTIRFNVLKDLAQEDANTFINKYRRGVEILRQANKKPTPAAVVRLMVEDGILPPPKRYKNEPGIRGGKGLSAAPMFKDANRDRQYRYDKYLFGHVDKSRRNQVYGYMPEELIYVDMAKANSALGDRPGRPMLHGGRHGGQYNVGADIVAPVQQLVDAGAAVRLHEDPRVRQLLQ